MSGGNNHYSSCTCPWCFHIRSRENTDAKSIDFKSDTLSAIVNPNARCPVCDAPVYYYRSPFNGRVFFDSLGWPWPKHPCTDNGRTVRRNHPAISGNQTELDLAHKWKEGGWIPIMFIRFGKPDEKGLRDLVVREVGKSSLHLLDVSNIPNEVEHDPAFIRATPDNEWEIDTPCGIFPAKKRKLNPNAHWRKRLSPLRNLPS
ncbi:MAG: hypothetical protein PHY43_04650 [Verrucomicrobiales bacterium]|nr:hypothetical protein [Verrucomicrobiales bacterium]